MLKQCWYYITFFGQKIYLWTCFFFTTILPPWHPSSHDLYCPQSGQRLDIWLKKLGSTEDPRPPNCSLGGTDCEVLFLSSFLPWWSILAEINNYQEVERFFKIFPRNFILSKFYICSQQSVRNLFICKILLWKVTIHFSVPFLNYCVLVQLTRVQVKYTLNCRKWI